MSRRLNRVSLNTPYLIINLFQFSVDDVCTFLCTINADQYIIYVLEVTLYLWFSILEIMLLMSTSMYINVINKTSILMQTF